MHRAVPRKTQKDCRRIIIEIYYRIFARKTNKDLLECSEIHWGVGVAGYPTDAEDIMAISKGKISTYKVTQGFANIPGMDPRKILKIITCSFNGKYISRRDAKMKIRKYKGMKYLERLQN
jgi:hypothetical protein